MPPVGGHTYTERETTEETRRTKRANDGERAGRDETGEGREEVIWRGRRQTSGETKSTDREEGKRER